MLLPTFQAMADVAESGAAAGDDAKPRHEQERGESSLRGENGRAIGDLADRVAWRGTMMLRWVAAGVLEAVKGFRRLKA